MKLSVKGLAIAVGVLWALCILIIGGAHVIWPGYAGAFLEVIASIYPGYQPAGGFAEVIVGTIYALVDGAIAGAVLAWIYNKVA